MPERLLHKTVAAPITVTLTKEEADQVIVLIDRAIRTQTGRIGALKRGQTYTNTPEMDIAGEETQKDFLQRLLRKFAP